MKVLTGIALTLLLSVIAQLSSATAVLSNPQFKVHPLALEEQAGADTVAFTLRDRDGFLWLATDNGLKRYDGYNLRIYTHNSQDPRSLGSITLTTLLEHSSGELWAIGNNFSRYVPAREDFDRFEVSNGLLTTAAIEDARGDIWFGGEGFGLRKFNPETAEVLTFFEADAKGAVVSIIYSADEDALWVAASAGVYRFDISSTEVKEFPLPAALRTTIEGSRNLLRDRDGKIWLGTRVGLLILDPATGQWRRNRLTEEPANNFDVDDVHALFQDSRGRIWIGTDKNGVGVFDPQQQRLIQIPASASPRYIFPLGTILHISEDVYGNLWFSAGSFGAFRINERAEKFAVIQHDPYQPTSLGFDNILDIIESADGKLYIATDGRGLDYFDPVSAQATHYRHDPQDPTSISSDSVIALAEDQQGVIWIGTWKGGLNRFDPKTQRFTRIAPASAEDGTALAGEHIFDIVVAADGRLLLSVWQHGLQIYNPADNSFVSYFPKGEAADSGAINPTINAIIAADKGRYWLGGFAGLELFDPASGSFETVPQLRQFDILDLFEDRLGVLWVATTHGLIRYSHSSGRTQTYTKADGLSDNYVVSIDADNLGRLWLGTRRGLTRFDPKNGEFLTFSESDGLAGLLFNRQSHLKTDAGLIYLGGTHGITFFDPINMLGNEHAPKVHLTEYDLFRSPAEFGDRLPRPKAINAYPSIELTFEQRDLGLEFTALSFQSPSSNRYKYRLLGLEQQWNEVDSSRRRVRYTNLPPGQYQFQVLGSNNEGVWSARPKTIDIKVLAAWWQTVWARLALALLIGSVGIGLFRWRMRANRQRQLILESLVEEKTAALQQANRSYQLLNAELEQRVNHRTRELSNEIEERKNSEARSYRLAYHDSLTGLKNREWLLAYIDNNTGTQGVGSFSLFYIGGDRFKQINDIYSQSVGDRLLCAVADKLRGLLPPMFEAVRLGGDEFALIGLEQWPQSRLVEFAEALISVFDQPLELGAISIRFSVSLGILTGSPHYQDASQILRDANIALRRAKDRGRGLYQLFDQEMLESTLEQAALEHDLRAALGEDQFHLVLQPIIDISSNAVSHFEALLRWRHPTRGMVAPDKFIPLAESTGLIGEIGLWVLERACLQLIEWRQTLVDAPSPAIAVNLSPLQLSQLDFLARLDEIFDRTGISPSNIKFEITESALMEHTDTIDSVLEALRGRGIELAIDDFGTGYSSLSYLDKLPVQVIKIDRAFVWALTDGSSTSAHEIVKATISLAHNLKLKVVAEGIETQAQLDILTSYSCDFGQGYFIAKPMSPTDAAAFLQRPRPVGSPLI